MHGAVNLKNLEVAQELEFTINCVSLVKFG